jgi:hypothetical protein
VHPDDQVWFQWSGSGADADADAVDVDLDTAEIEMEMPPPPPAVGRCRLTVSNPELKACLVSAISA